jgi:hypothetical protein
VALLPFKLKAIPFSDMSISAPPGPYASFLRGLFAFSSSAHFPPYSVIFTQYCNISCLYSCAWRRDGALGKRGGTLFLTLAIAGTRGPCWRFSFASSCYSPFLWPPHSPFSGARAFYLPAFYRGGDFPNLYGFFLAVAIRGGAPLFPHSPGGTRTHLTPINSRPHVPFCY